PLEQRAEDLERLLQHRPGIADDEGPEGGADDDQGFEGLHQHLEMAALRDIAANDADDDAGDADQETHEQIPSGEPRRRQIWVPKGSPAVRRPPGARAHESLLSR